ncbi:MAG: sigma-70 family RNA polymerase sigma factor [Planctomycetes bacterium]|nr:sigma-70 family RNA polymerase sigma factor [Planctomycetota bacterium]
MDVSTPNKELVEELVRRHQDGVRGFLLYQGAPPHLVDDLVQETFLAFLAARFDERSETATSAFLRTIARHLFLKTMERERRAPVLMDEDAAEAAWVEFERDDGGTSYLAAMRDCLARLRGRALEVVLLRYKDGLRRTAIGERLGLSESGVKALLIRARAALRECVERGLA